MNTQGHELAGSWAVAVHLIDSMWAGVLNTQGHGLAGSLALVSNRPAISTTSVYEEASIVHEATSSYKNNWEKQRKGDCTLSLVD